MSIVTTTGDVTLAVKIGAALQRLGGDSITFPRNEVFHQTGNSLEFRLYIDERFIAFEIFVDTSKTAIQSHQGSVSTTLDDTFSFIDQDTVKALASRQWRVADDKTGITTSISDKKIEDLVGKLIAKAKDLVRILDIVDDCHANAVDSFNKAIRTELNPS